MWGRCSKCGRYANLNPYPDSKYYGMCFACQLKLKEEIENENKKE